MAYTGGPSRIFKRAESAANFGREVGLQYVHAHIRYIEALARIGRPDDAFRALMAICPILLERDVPTALPRQSNAYFSSSDAAFVDRRQASRQFGRLRSGTIGVKGGWRVYSSGPGIYLNQLVSNVLGLRAYFDDVVIDPVLPRHADGLTFDFEWEGRPVRYRYEVKGPGFGPTEVRVNGASVAARRATDNPYREGGLLISKRVFSDALDERREPRRDRRLSLRPARAEPRAAPTAGCPRTAAAATTYRRGRCTSVQRDGLGTPGRGAGCASYAGSSSWPPTSSQIRMCRLSRM